MIYVLRWTQEPNNPGPDSDYGYDEAEDDHDDESSK